jgi:hypothetical protein
MSYLISPDVKVLHNTTAYDATVVAAYNLGTNNSTMRFGIYVAIFEAVNVSGSGIISPTISVGTNSSSYNNIISGTGTLTGANNRIARISFVNFGISAAPGTDIFFNVSSKATNATSFNIKVYLVGVYY